MHPKTKWCIWHNFYFAPKLKHLFNINRLQMLRFCVSPRRAANAPPAGRTIHDAVRHADADALARHLVFNTNVNAHDRWGLTPLYIAAEKGDVRLVRILLGMGADPGLSSTVESGCVPPLVVAATHGHTECLNLLLASGAPIHASDRWGNTALLKACSSGHSQCVQDLLTKGADPAIPNHWNSTCLEASASQGFAEILTFLMSSDKFDVRSREVRSALITAASRGRLDCVEALLNAGCSPDNDCAESWFPCDEQQPGALFFALACCAADNDDTTEEDEGDLTDLRVRKDPAKCVTALIRGGAEVCAMCLELLPDVVCQNEGKYLHTAIEVLLAANRNLANGLHTRERNAMKNILLQLDTVPETNHCEVIDAVLKLGYKPSGEIIQHLEHYTSEENVQSLQDATAEPGSLFNLSRLVVRSTLRPNVTFATKSLPLPTRLMQTL